MPQPRKNQVSLDATSFYHCSSRCVRRAFLCGVDQQTGQTFEHRRGWIEERMLLLSKVFSMDICAHAIMSNHTHIIVHINKTRSDLWGDREVIQRWHRLFKGIFLSQEYLAGKKLHKTQLRALKKTVKAWRERLTSISWFMRCLNEFIARAANNEDKCTGRFWEGRFKCQALVDEQSLLTCMAYADLNPIRARMAKTPETSDHTSIKLRIEEVRKAAESEHKKQQDSVLFPFAGNIKANMPEGIPYYLTDYIELVDWTGRCIRDDKRGYIDNNLPPILDRLGISPKNWLCMTTEFEKRFKSIAGSACNVRQACEVFGKAWTHGIHECETLFSG